MRKDSFRYQTYSRRTGTITSLASYRDNLIDFESRPFPNQDIGDTINNIDSGLNYGWAAAVLAYLYNLPIGVTTLYAGRKVYTDYSVGIAFVNEENRRKGVWQKMSLLIETEARNSGALSLVRNISWDASFLNNSLSRQGYVCYSSGELVKHL
ncbi:MAG: hypothetical protein WAV40_02125 [Microgenomates group bacterium]